MFPRELEPLLVAQLLSLTCFRATLINLLWPKMCCFISWSFTPLMNIWFAFQWIKFSGDLRRAWCANCSMAAVNSSKAHHSAGRLCMGFSIPLWCLRMLLPLVHCIRCSSFARKIAWCSHGLSNLCDRLRAWPGSEMGSRRWVHLHHNDACLGIPVVSPASHLGLYCHHCVLNSWCMVSRSSASHYRTCEDSGSAV
jgi:hypothetical protein